MGVWDDWWGSEDTDPSTIQTTTLSPEQTRVSEAFEGWLTPNIGQGLQPYQGQVVSPLTQDELDAQNRIRALVGSSKTQLSPEVAAMYRTMLSGKPTSEINPQTTQDYYQNTIYGPALRQFKEDVIPNINESFAGPGYFGEARGRTVGKAGESFAEDLLGRRSELFYRDEQAKRALKESAAARALQSGPLAQAFGAYERERPYQEAGMLSEMGSLQRKLDQFQLDFNYKEFLRIRPETAPYLNYALQFLGIPTTATMGVQGQQGSSGMAGNMLGDMLSGFKLSDLFKTGNTSTGDGFTPSSGSNYNPGSAGTWGGNVSYGAPSWTSGYGGGTGTSAFSGTGGYSALT